MLLDAIETDPVVGIAAPRPDFDGALQEFLIGLFTAALAPVDEVEWKSLRDHPPKPDELQAKLDALPDAFDLEGDGPRFFQDLDAAAFAAIGISTVDQLLIDSPGEQGIRLNKDLFVKRGRAERLGRPAAAMALLTLQTYAPAGGQGHRTSLRGGGPLTTLVDPRVDVDGTADPAQPLWMKLWANVETREQLDSRTPREAPTAIEAAFPWLWPPHTSNPREGGGPTSAGGAHPLEAYFAVPRRIRLEFGDGGVCDLTGRPDERTVTGFRMRNYGAQYLDWRHPLSPHYRTKPAEPWLPVHGQPGGVGWRDWLGLALEDPNDIRQPAATVAAYRRRSSQKAPPVRLHVFGYDMDNMKARGWTEASLPLFPVAERERLALMRKTAANLVEATGIAASVLHGTVKRVLFDDPKEAPGDVSHVRTELWSATEREFYHTMARLADPAVSAEAMVDAATKARQDFAPRLRAAALEVFDRWCPADGLKVEMLRRRVVARYDLSGTLAGYTKLGEKLLEQLGVPLPGGGIAARKRKRTEAAT